MSAEIFKFEPRYVEARLEAALDADEAGDVERALSEAEAALARAPRDPRGNALAAVYSALLDRERDALGYARKALAHRTVTGEVAYWAGVARHIAGADQLALDALEITLALDPDDEQARYLSGRCRERLDRIANQ